MKHYREVWKDHHGEIPKDENGKSYHIHHILPQSEGGGDNIENLIALSAEDHYDVHLERGDYGACALLSDGIDRKAPTVSVRQYDLDGHFVKEWESSTEAGAYINPKKPGSTQGGIITCCKYNQSSIGDFQWFYTDEVGDADYVGPVKRLHKYEAGNNTTKKYYTDIITGNVIYGKRECCRISGISQGSTAGNEFNNRFKEITIKNKEDEK